MVITQRHEADESLAQGSERGHIHRRSLGRRGVVRERVFATDEFNGAATMLLSCQWSVVSSEMVLLI